MNNKWKIINADTNTYSNSDNRQIKLTSTDGRVKLFLKNGPYPVTEPEINANNLSESQLHKLLNTTFLQNRRRCFACGDNKRLGICLTVHPSAMTEAEKTALENSILDEKINVNILGQEPKPKEEEGWYEMYKTNPKPTESVKPLTSESSYKLETNIVPAYVCTVCRRQGQCGSKDADIYGHHPHFPEKFVVPTLTQRNVVNKYEQRDCGILFYKDSSNKLYNVTDRFIVITSEQEAQDYENNILQQLELLHTPSKLGELESLKKSDVNKFYTELAHYIKHVIPSLLLASAKLTTTQESNEISDLRQFEPSYEYSLIFIRGALHLLKQYPQAKEQLSKELHSSNWLDAVWIASLTKVPFSEIKHSVVQHLLTTISALVGKEDDKCRNMCRQLLYTVAFSNMIYEILSSQDYDGTTYTLDEYKCYLPDESLLRVWSEMKYINEYIQSTDYLEAMSKHLLIEKEFLEKYKIVEIHSK